MNDDLEELERIKKIKFRGSREATRMLLDIANGADPLKKEKTQETLNKPLKDETGLEKADKELLDLIVKNLKDGTIDPLSVSSILNQGVYEALPDEKSDKVDLHATNILSTIRRIQDLVELNDRVTFQMQNLIHEFRLKKEAVEKEFGDVFII